MTVSCPECRSVFRVDPAKVPATGVRARCSVCGGVIAIAGGTLPVSVTPVASSMAVPAFGAGVSRATPALGASSALPAAATAAAVTGTPSGAPVVAAAATPVAAPAVPPVLRRPTPIATSIATPGSVPRAPTPSTPAGVVGAPAPRSQTPVASAAQPVVTNTPAVGTSIPTTGTAPTPAAGRKPINPFLRADPSQRARRLARALVSDLVAYHPQKREEGLRDGTLRQLFREEIKKSYEEYVEQVGREVAESAPHFQEALNEILAGGRRLF